MTWPGIDRDRVGETDTNSWELSDPAFYDSLQVFAFLVFETNNAPSQSIH